MPAVYDRPSALAVSAEVELVPERVAVEAEHEPAQDPRRRRAEHVEPEQLDVLRAHVVADRVDDRVVPWHDHQGWFGHRDVELGGSHRASLAGRERFGGVTQRCTPRRPAQQRPRTTQSSRRTVDRSCLIVPVDDRTARCCGDVRRPRTRQALDRHRRLGHRLHGRRHLHRFGHPRLSRPERRVDEEPGGGEGVDVAALPRRSRRAPRARGRTGCSHRRGPPCRTAGTWRSTSSNAKAGCGPSSRRTSTSCTSKPAINLHKVIEVHGTMRWSRCWTCGDRRPMPEILERVRAGDPDPACELLWTASSRATRSRSASPSSRR